MKDAAYEGTGRTGEVVVEQLNRHSSSSSAQILQQLVQCPVQMIKTNTITLNPPKQQSDVVADVTQTNTEGSLAGEKDPWRTVAEQSGE